VNCRAVEETVMVVPRRIVADRTPAQYRTVMVPQTVMVAPAAHRNDFAGFAPVQLPYGFCGY
jgi:hypothetical protein